ncbi:MAG: glycoside hydrolase family 3 protein [Actinobacteria bacterium]|nr:glycoside hydrolase family 3 protein [Actinomycetota bacterium]
MNLRPRAVAFGGAAVLVVSVGIPLSDREAGAGNRGSAPAQRAAAAAESLSRQAGRLVVLRFAGTSAPAYVREALREGRVAGVILFRDNLKSPAQAKVLTAQLRQGSWSSPLICVDQEGGEVRIVPWAGPARSAAQQAAGGTERADATAAARGLRAAGINVSLAPVADVPSVPGAALASRAFSTDFARVAESVAKSVRGWRKGSVAPAVKHFPGLGGATVNTDDGSVTIARSAAQLRRRDLLPFRTAIAAGTPLVMVGHALYPALDRRRIASQSKAVVEALLRGELGYRGVVITDSTEAAAVQAVTGLAQAAVRNVRAGVDIVLTTGRGSYSKIYRALLTEARRDPVFRARVRESAARVAALQQALARVR